MNNSPYRFRGGFRVAHNTLDALDVLDVYIDNQSEKMYIVFVHPCYIRRYTLPLPRKRYQTVMFPTNILYTIINLSIYQSIDLSIY